MQSPVPLEDRVSIAEYLRLEEHSREKHEYHGGRVIAMAGGSPEHSLITMNFGAELRNRLKGGPCRVYDSNLRIRIPRKPLYAYPDISVICGQLQLDQDDSTGRSAINPRLIVEVLSPSTEAYDRGDKFRRYLAIESLQEYVLASQVVPRIETFYRQPGGEWLFAHAVGIEAVVRIRSLDIQIPLGEIYAGITFPPEAAGDAEA